MYTGACLEIFFTVVRLSDDSHQLRPNWKTAGTNAIFMIYYYTMTRVLYKPRKGNNYFSQWYKYSALLWHIGRHIMRCHRWCYLPINTRGAEWNMDPLYPQHLFIAKFNHNCRTTMNNIYNQWKCTKNDHNDNRERIYQGFSLHYFNKYLYYNY